MPVVGEDFQRALQAHVRGEVAFDEVTRGIYATDASHYQVMPRCVVTPVDEQDAITAVRIACRHRIPITARGGGTSLSGQTTWTGLVLDMSRHLDQVLEVNVAERWARVQPGVVRDTLNASLKAHGLHFAPDPATGNRATIGGMIGNNSSGTRSILYGKTLDHTLECKVLLADGSILTLGPTSPAAWNQIEQGGSSEARIFRGIRQIIETNADEIKLRFPKVMRRVSGYNLDAFVAHARDQQTSLQYWNPAALIVGSEGTLGVLLEAKIKLEPNLAATAICVVHFNDLFESLATVPALLEFNPSAVELLDGKVVRESRRNVTTKALSGVFVGQPGAVLIVELHGEDPSEVNARVARMASDLATRRIGCAWPILSDADGQRDVWELRKLGLGLIANAPGRRKGLEFIEDTCVPVDCLARYIREVYDVCQRHGIDVTSYAHASVGVIHIRPMLDPHDPADIQLMREIAYEVFQLVKKYDGSWSSEHGDGFLRGEFVRPFFGDQIYGAFRELKQLFDPQGLMNPGKIVDSPRMTENLRYGSQYARASLPTLFHYRDHGSLQQAVEQCNGVGACRKIGSGVMCPSYMATRDEQHTTRGRANALRLAISGQLPHENLSGDRVAEVLQLCLACKACKSECPTSVDVARFKSEVLQMRYDERGTPRAAKLIADLPKFLRKFPFAISRLGDQMQRVFGLDHIARSMLGFDHRRRLPSLATQSFQDWYRAEGQLAAATQAAQGDVTLFIDTFTNYMEPQIGIAAVNLLRGCGYRVFPFTTGCCQRMAISKGLLRDAQQQGTSTLQALDQYQVATKVVAIEPSCASSLIDDLPDLCDDRELGERVAGRVSLLDDFLAHQISSGRLDHVRLTSTQAKLILHTHCHQKSLFDATSLATIFRRVPGLDWRLIAAGCCGMAGAFGYEHYDLSRQIAEDRLLPAIRACESDRIVVATGTSCRQQIRDLAQVDARHWVEIIQAL